MKRSHPGTTLLPLAMLFSALLACGGTGLRDSDFTGPDSSKNTFAVWAHSEIRPSRHSQRECYESAIADISAEMPSINAAIVAGNIVHDYQSADVFRWFLKSRTRAGVPSWFEIPGERDVRDAANFKKLIRPESRYAARAGNLLFLFLGEEFSGSPRRVSAEAFQWWSDTLDRHPGSIIVTVTHAQLAGCGLFGSDISDNTIEGSERFIEAMRKRHVDIWLSGNMHIPGFFNGKWKVNRETGGTLFVNVGSIIREFPGGVESSVLLFKKGEPYCLVRSRSHENRRWEKKGEVVHRLSRPFEWDGSPPVIVGSTQGRQR